jgi:hypothetical protein
MRLSGLVVAAVLFVSTTLIAHTSGAGGSGGFASSGGSSSSSASHGGYSGGFSSSSSSSSSSVHSGGSASSHNSSNSVSHVTSTSAGTSHSSPSTKLSSTKESAAPEKRGFFSSLRHPFRKPAPVKTAEFLRPPPCLKAPCAVCPPGQSRNGNGPCVFTSNVCPPWQFGNGFGCGTQTAWFSNCRALADQLAEQQARMRGQNDPGESLRYQVLKNQYEQCIRRFGSGFFGSSDYNSALLLDTP